MADDFSRVIVMGIAGFKFGRVLRDPSLTFSKEYGDFVKVTL